LGARAYGQRAAAIASRWDLSLFEFALSDWVGHRANPDQAVAILELYDSFLGGVLESRPTELAVVVTSDHGNLEAPRSQLHTRNPVPLLWLGPGAAEASAAKRLTDVPRLVRAHLGLPAPPPLPPSPSAPLPRPHRPRPA
jgi:bisphosphoglycerate-independent phosphoglycerate mutase (AlkP superfamily)